MKNKKRLKLLVSIACFALSLFFLLAVPHPAYAADLDEIENYEITADVSEDATVTLHYHIDWRVLDSDSASTAFPVVISPEQVTKHTPSSCRNFKVLR